MIYPTFLINLDHHVRRRAFMEEQFAALDLPLTRLGAALGRDPAVRAQAAVAGYATLTHGEIGCFESHRWFWRHVVAENLPGAFVIEDDVVIASDFGQIRFPDTLLQQADVIKIDQGVRNICAYGTVPVGLENGRNLYRLLGTEYSTGCYFVTQRGARRLLEASRGYFVPVDRFMFDQDSKAFWSFDIWKLDPSAAVQYRLFDPDDDVQTEIDDSISANRLSGRDETPGMNMIKQTRLRMRRLFDWDFRRIREARKARKLEEFARLEPVETRKVAFHSASSSHVEPARKALGSEASAE
ncbi:glycosyltransferase family 25 protein [uncultured Roseobacter sp.]|uniref:glycosyltransferase family 25 protein n=1 Tax=uncultured Roseobacter sp. TaxID=114847 RepID=UPI00261BCDB5|nr:glycosyltransferase family 25 protein [uncultured Roseobacter sp.]